MKNFKDTFKRIYTYKDLENNTDNIKEKVELRNKHTTRGETVCAILEARDFKLIDMGYGTKEDFFNGANSYEEFYSYRESEEFRNKEIVAVADEKLLDTTWRGWRTIVSEEGVSIILKEVLPYLYVRLVPSKRCIISIEPLVSIKDMDKMTDIAKEYATKIKWKILDHTLHFTFEAYDNMIFYSLNQWEEKELMDNFIKNKSSFDEKGSLLNYEYGCSNRRIAI